MQIGRRVFFNKWNSRNNSRKNQTGKKGKCKKNNLAILPSFLAALVEVCAWFHWLPADSHRQQKFRSFSNFDVLGDFFLLLEKREPCNDGSWLGFEKMLNSRARGDSIDTLEAHPFQITLWDPALVNEGFFNTSPVCSCVPMESWTSYTRILLLPA